MQCRKLGSLLTVAFGEAVAVGNAVGAKLVMAMVTRVAAAAAVVSTTVVIEAQAAEAAPERDAAAASRLSSPQTHGLSNRPSTPAE